MSLNRFCSDVNCQVLLTKENSCVSAFKEGGYCRMCAKHKIDEWRNKNREHIREYSKRFMRSQLSTSKVAEAGREYRRKNPEAARAAVNKYAVKNRDNKKTYDWKLERRHKHFTTKYLRKEGTPQTDLLWSCNFYKELLRDDECHYCGGAILDSYGCKLDRMDSAIGHLCYNVVPCCSSCNVRKMHDLSYEEMLLLSPVLREIRRRRLLRYSEQA